MGNDILIREQILEPMYQKLLVSDIIEGVGHRTLELDNFYCVFDTAGDGFIDINGIFKTSKVYVERELEWYYSQNPNTASIAPHASTWARVSDEAGMANSNYGFLMFSPQNGYQYQNIVKRLRANPKTKKAVAYYTNPMIHYTGGNDTICTIFVAYLNRGGTLNASVYLRSNDARYGLIGADLSWQIHMLKKLAEDTNAQVGKVHWYATSMHLYEKHWEGLRRICQ